MAELTIEVMVGAEPADAEPPNGRKRNSAGSSFQRIINAVSEKQNSWIQRTLSALTAAELQNFEQKRAPNVFFVRNGGQDPRLSERSRYILDINETFLFYEWSSPANMLDGSCQKSQSARSVSTDEPTHSSASFRRFRPKNFF